jgi:periplasmic protein TonB
MKRFNTALVLSIALHAGVFALAYVSWKTAPPKMAVPSVPIELVSEVPMREQAEAPVDELAVKTPEPEPAPEVPVVEPKPDPAPKLPVPVPQKPAAPKPEPKPEKKPDPKPVEKPKPDPKGVKKPEPPKQTKPKTSAADDLLSRLAAAPSQATSKKPAQANTRRTDGRSNQGTAPATAGKQTNLAALTRRLQNLWSPNCDVPGARLVSPELAFTISPNGRVVQGPEWLNRRSDPVWQAAASRAMSAVKQGELYDDLPADLYNKRIEYTFDGNTACGG